MKKLFNDSKYQELRRRFPLFEYQSYTIEKRNQSLEFSFLFKMGEEIVFKPSYSIPYRSFFDLSKVSDTVLENLVFHIGMVELISYWKAACPPQVVIKPFSLSEEQVGFWKKLYLNGLGEFFYLNGIDPGEDFMVLESEGKRILPSSWEMDDRAVMVPVGGGKDSVVTLELLKKLSYNIFPMAMNPRPAIERTITIAGFDNGQTIVVKRKLDKKLLELNDKGFLNGHTPFSALLAFVTLLPAALSGIKHIALSNEASANESTVPGSKINHQYSKSLEFENDFRNYVKKYISREVNYFSFLRPLSELQIAALFARFKGHHLSFRSCNVGSKKDVWCGSCPKCLFTRIILGPFLEQEQLRRIFGKELLDDDRLKHYFDELTGKIEVKPFECVGTPREVSLALSKIKSNWEKGKEPHLLRGFVPVPQWETAFDRFMRIFEPEHNLPKPFFELLSNEMKR